MVSRPLQCTEAMLWALLACSLLIYLNFPPSNIFFGRMWYEWRNSLSYRTFRTRPRFCNLRKTRGQWPYRPAATREMKIGHMQSDLNSIRSYSNVPVLSYPSECLYSQNVIKNYSTSSSITPIVSEWHIDLHGFAAGKKRCITVPYIFCCGAQIWTRVKTPTPSPFFTLASSF